MIRWIVAAGIPLVFGAALAACSESGSGTTFGDGGPCPDKTPPVAQSDADMSVEDLTDLVAEAITCPGYAFHMRSAGDTESGPYSSYSETEVWIDMQSGVGRVEQLFRITSDEALAEAATAEAEGEDYGLESQGTMIVRSDGSYSSGQGDRPAGRGRSPSCHGPGREALWPVLGCFDGPLQHFEISIDPNGSYNGRDAIAYVAEGESSGSDETYYTTRRAFFDAETLLPVGTVVEGTLDIGDSHPVESDVAYEHEFVPLDSLPEDFFDPASIGYVEPDVEEVEKPLDDADIDFYWLGREFNGSDGYPALTLDHASARPGSQSGEGGSAVEMTYRPADDEFGYLQVRIWLYPPEAWEFRKEHSGVNPCVETEELEFEGAQAFVVSKYHDSRQSGSECPPHDRFAAEVHFEDLVIEIDAPAIGGGGETRFSSYDSEEGLELLVRRLELRE